MSYQKNLRVLTVAVVVLTAVSLIVGCSSKSTLDTSTPPSANSIAIIATPSTLATNESSVVEATVVNSGSAVEGQVILFSVTPDGAGSVAPTSATTASDGTAAVVFSPSAAGAVTVTATIEGTSTARSTNLLVSQAEVGGSGNITISSSRALLMANGEDTSQITIVIRDGLGQPAAVGTLVKIAAGEKFRDIDSNGYFSQNIDEIVFDANDNGQWDAIGHIPATATVTGAVGEVVVDYVSGDEAHTVYIKATVNDGGILGDAELAVQLTPSAIMHSIYLSSDSISLSVKTTGGIESGTLHATGYDNHGNPVPEGMPITFVIIDGPGGGEALDTVGNNGIDVAYTNSLGVASTSVSSGTISGTMRIRAFADSIVSNATQILISAGPPQYIVVAAEFCNVPYWNRVGDSVKIVAVVSDVYLNPVNDSTVVYFTTDEGTMQSHQERTWGGKGIALSAWFAGNNVPTADGIVWIYAETSGGTVRDSNIFINSYVADTILVSGWNNSILADGESKFSIWIGALDVNRNYVVDGISFKAEANFLTVTGGVFSDGCFGSNDRVTVLSATLSKDYSTTGANDDGIGAVDQVTYWVGGNASITLTCNLLTGDAYSKASSIESPTTAQPGEVVNLSVAIADRWGNPLGDHTLNMTAGSGVVGGGTQESDEYGEAFGFTWTAPALDGDYNVVVTDTDPRGGGMVLTQKITVKAATK